MSQEESPVRAIRRISDALGSAFSHLGPATTVVTAVGETLGVGWGASFDVAWQDRDPGASTLLVAEIATYRGRLRWAAGREFNDRGVRVSALPKGFPGSSWPLLSVVDLEREIHDFAQFIRERIGASKIRVSGLPVQIDPEWATGFSAFDVFLVRAPDTFAHDTETFDLLPTSVDDVRLYETVDEADLSALSSELRAGQIPLPALGDELISRLFDIYSRIIIRRSEEEEIMKFLDGLLPRLGQQRSRRVIGRLQRIVREAERRDLGVVLEPSR